MLDVVIYNEFINETLNLVNEKQFYARLIKFSSRKVHCAYNIKDALSNLRKT